MTEETPETPEVEPEEEAASEEPEAFDLEDIEDVDLERCDLAFLINLVDIKSLSEAVDIAAVNLGRYGLDAFQILATDPDTGRQWIIHDGKVQDATEFMSEQDGG